MACTGDFCGHPPLMKRAFLAAERIEEKQILLWFVSLLVAAGKMQKPQSTALV